MWCTPLQVVKCWCVRGVGVGCAGPPVPGVEPRTLGWEDAAVREGSREPGLLTRLNGIILWLDRTPLGMSHKQAGLHVPPHQTPQLEDTTIMYLYPFQ